MSFLAGLSSEYETAKSQILSNFKISSLHDTFARVLHIKSTQFSQPTSSALVSQNTNGQQSSTGGNKGGNPSNRSNQRNREANFNQD